MIEIEKYPCKDKPEAIARERVIQAEMKAKLNSDIPGRTDKEYQKEYYENNHEKLLEYQKEYRRDNHQKLLEKNKEKITCECGLTSFRSNIARHRKTDNHKKKMEALAN